MHRPGDLFAKTWRLTALLSWRRFSSEMNNNLNPAVRLQTPVGNADVSGIEEDGDLVWYLTWPGDPAPVEIKRDAIGGFPFLSEISVSLVAEGSFEMTGEDHAPASAVWDGEQHEWCDSEGAEWLGCMLDWCGFPDNSASYGKVHGCKAGGVPTGDYTLTVTSGDFSEAFSDTNIALFDNEEVNAILDVSGYASDYTLYECGTVIINADHCAYPDIGSGQTIELDYADPPLPWKRIDYSGMSATLRTYGSGYYIQMWLGTLASKVKLRYDFDFTDLAVGKTVTVENIERTRTYDDETFAWVDAEYGDFVVSRDDVVDVEYQGFAFLKGVPARDRMLYAAPNYYVDETHEPYGGHAIEVWDIAPEVHRIRIKPSTLTDLGQPYFPNADPHLETGNGLASVEIEAGQQGTGYAEDDILYLAEGIGGTAVVLTVDGSGVIQEVDLGAVGYGYSTGVKDTTTNSVGGSGARVHVLTLGDGEQPIGFGDWRLPMRLDDWYWDALKIVHNTGVELYKFNDKEGWSGTGCTITADANRLSVVVSGASRAAVGDFMPGDQFSGVNKGTKLSSAIGVGDGHIDVTSTTDFPDTGDLTIEDVDADHDVIHTVRYTSKTGTTFTLSEVTDFAVNLNYDRKVQLVGPWFSHYRFVKVQWLPKFGGAADTSGSMRLHLGNKWWDLTYKTADLVGGYLQTEIDLCRPHGLDVGSITNSSAQQSWMDYWFPRSRGQITTVGHVAGSEAVSERLEMCDILVAARGRQADNEWYWGVSKVEAVQLSELEDGHTYLLGTITGVIKTDSKLVTTNQFGWRADRETDQTGTPGQIAKVRSGLRAQIDAEEGMDARFAESDEILGWIVVDGMVAAEITGMLWDQLCGESPNECCGVTCINGAIGYLDGDDHWVSNLEVWPKRLERTPKATIVVEPFEEAPDGTPPYCSNLLDVRHLKLQDNLPITTQKTWRSYVTTDEFAVPTSGGYLAVGEYFTFNVTKHFGHDLHGLAFEDLRPARYKSLKFEYGSTVEYHDTDGDGAFNVHVPYQGDAEVATITRSSGTEHVDIPLRQRRMTFGALGFEPVPASGSLSSDQDEVGQVFLVT